MSEELMVNESAFLGEQEDYDAIREAIEKLSAGSQDQFEAMKKEKWYNRVFDMVTFSQKGKKRLAEQVSTLAQAQQIFIELLLRLSSNDVNISNIVGKSMEDIKRISEQNIYLLTKIKRLEDISLGIKADMNINDLSEKDKQVLCAFLYKINSKNNNTSNEQRAYANAVMSYLDMDVQMDNPVAGLEKMDTDSKRRILACCMEYIFLQDCTQKSFDDNREFIDVFDIGNKTIKEIEEQIVARYKLRGIDGFCSKYVLDDFEEPEEFFSIEIDAMDEQEEEEPVEMTEETISSILQIRSGETKSYENKHLHFAAYVNCEGDIKIDHCAIYYNESELGDEITLAEGANLYIRDSVIVCKGFDTNYFISCAGKNEVVFENTIFYDCSYMIKSGNSINFSMKNCKLKNCFDEFVHIFVGEKEVCDISSNVILQNDLSQFHIDNLDRRYPQLFYIQGGKGAESIKFYNNLIKEDESFRKATGKKISSWQYIFCDSGEVFNCTFIGISSAIGAAKVRECKFENCKEAITTIIGSYSYNSVIDNCVFENCTDVIRADDHTQITNCQFISCYDNIIKGDYFGGVHIEFCQFINIKNLFAEAKNLGVFRIPACITFKRAKERNANANYIKKCIFDGIELQDAFLIAADGIEKPSGVVTYIEECSFKNCSTKRASGKIIKEYLQYDTVFKKKQDFHANTISPNCRGLDKINKEGKKAAHVEVRTQATTGNIIGSSIGKAVVKAVAASVGPVGLGVAAGISAINTMNKGK